MFDSKGINIIDDFLSVPREDPADDPAKFVLFLSSLISSNISADASCV